MRFSEFATTKNIAFIKFNFEKVLNNLIIAAKKEAKINKNKLRMAKQRAKNKRIASLKKTNTKTNNMILNTRPKRT